MSAAGVFLDLVLLLGGPLASRTGPTLVGFLRLAPANNGARSLAPTGTMPAPAPGVLASSDIAAYAISGSDSAGKPGGTPTPHRMSAHEMMTASVQISRCPMVSQSQQTSWSLPPPPPGTRTGATWNAMKRPMPSAIIPALRDIHLMASQWSH